MEKSKHSIEWMTVPWGQPSKDDPLGQRGYFGWKLTYRGKNYGQVVILSYDGRPFDDHCDEAKIPALEQALDVLRQLSKAPPNG